MTKELVILCNLKKKFKARLGLGRGSKGSESFDTKKLFKGMFHLIENFCLPVMLMRETVIGLGVMQKELA